jgi:diguanylate cyclase (GGDEF)-like protein
MDVSTWPRKKTVLTLRWFLVITISYMIVFGVPFPEVLTKECLLVFFLIISNIVLSFFPARFFDKWSISSFLMVLDTIVVSLGIYLSGSASSDFYIVYFLVILLASLGRDLRRVIFNSLFVTGSYTVLLILTSPGALIRESAIMVRIPFILLFSLFYGYIMDLERGRRGRVKKLEKENRELEALIDITRLVASTLDTKKVLKLLVQKVEKVLEIDRCSVLFIKGGDTRLGYVMASQDNPEIDRFEIDLMKYPEVKKSIETGEIVVIDDSLEDPLVSDVGNKIQQAGFNSLLVVPMAHGEEMFGTLLLRAASSKKGFGDWEVKFCQVVANASANALKNAQLFQEIKRQAITDGLTEMFNHRYFQEQFRIVARKAKMGEDPLSILMIDIDNFKWINDYYGHTVGDQAIRFIAEKLRVNSRENDIVARYGGDEFIWLLTDTDIDIAMKVANRFRKSVTSKPFEATGYLSVSIGVATYPTDTPNVARLLHQADRAMYLSKGEGGNRVRAISKQEAGEVLDWGEVR